MMDLRTDEELMGLYEDACGNPEEEEDREMMEEAPEVEASLENEYETRYGQSYSQEEWMKIIADYNGADPAARNIAGEKAYRALKPFIHSIARKFYSTYLPKYGEDLLNEGALGLCESLKTYDPYKGRPTTWCYRSIVHCMREFIDREIHHTTPHYQGNIKKIRDFISGREAAGIPWTYDDIVVHTGISLTTVLNCIMIDYRNQNSVSAEQEVGQGDTQALLRDYIPSSIPGPEESYFKKVSETRLLEDMRQCLSDKERIVLMLHYGFGDDTPKSTSEIERITSIRKPEIRPLLNMAEYKLRKYINYNESYSTERHDRRYFRQDSAISLLKSKDRLVEELDSFVFDELESLD